MPALRFRPEGGKVKLSPIESLSLDRARCRGVWRSWPVLPSDPTEAPNPGRFPPRLAMYHRLPGEVRAYVAAQSRSRGHQLVSWARSVGPQRDREAVVLVAGRFYWRTAVYRRDWWLRETTDDIPF